MNQIMEFLAEYYLYVALGSLGIIIILLLIIFLGKKKEKRKENEQMVNMGDIKTGTIDEVANNMSQNNDAFLQPQNIGEVTQSIPVVNEINNQELSTGPALEVEPITEMESSIPNIEASAPTVEMESPIPNIEAPVPTVEMEPSIPNIEAPVPTVEMEPSIPNIEAPAPTVEMEPSIPNIEAPAPTEPESLEIFGVDDETPKGTAVAGFSSVNLEK